MFGEYILEQQGIFVYLVVFFSLLGGAFFLPFPEDLILITTGVLIHKELASPELICVVAYSAIVLGDIVLYSIGYFFGPNLFAKRWFRNRIHPKKIKKVKEHLEQNHITAIFIGRHLFYLRSLTFVMCGAVKMNFVKYIIADLIAALFSCSLMISIGYFAAENFIVIQEHFDNVKNVLFLIILAVGAYFYYRFRKNKQ